MKTNTSIKILAALITLSGLSACSTVPSPTHSRAPASEQEQSSPILFKADDLDYDYAVLSFNVSGNKTKSITVTNSSGTPITGVYISLEKDQFQITNNHCGNPDAYASGPLGWNTRIGSDQEVVIPAGATCTFDLVFKAKSLGTHSDQITVNYLDGFNSERTATLPIVGVRAD